MVPALDTIQTRADLCYANRKFGTDVQTTDMLMQGRTRADQAWEESRSMGHLKRPGGIIACNRLERPISLPYMD